MPLALATLGWACGLGVGAAGWLGGTAVAAGLGAAVGCAAGTVVAAVLDQYVGAGRVGPLEVQTGVAVDRDIEPDHAARRIGRDPVQMPEALLELVAGPEHRLKQRRGDLTDAAGDARHSARAVVPRGDAQAPLEASVDRRRTDGVVEREGRTRGNHDAGQALGRQLAVVLLFGHG